VVRFSLLNRIGRRSSSGAAAGPQPVFRRAPSPGALRRERRAIVKAREERVRHLGGLTLEMYRRSSFRDQLLIEQCREIVALEDRLRELDSMLEAVATARRAPATCECGAPVPWGSHFCANCGRPVGAEPVVACESCGHPLSADATFCAHCGHPVETTDEPEPQPEAEAEPKTDVEAQAEEPAKAIDETILQSADPWER
jgi:Double zinc ribbon